MESNCVCKWCQPGDRSRLRCDIFHDQGKLGAAYLEHSTRTPEVKMIDLWSGVCASNCSVGHRKPTSERTYDGCVS